MIFENVGDIFFSKVAQMSGEFYSFLNDITFQVETDVSTFWATLGKLGLLFTSISGHAVGRSTILISNFDNLIVVC